MPRSILFFCALMMFLLPACAAGDNQTILEDITARYAAAEQFDSRVSIRAELPERTTSYVIDWHYAQGRSTMTVLEPTEIAGISVETDDQGLTFRYADAVLVVDASGEGVSPLEALPELYFGWAGGLIEDYTTEPYQDIDALVVTYSHKRGTDDYTQRVWFDPQRQTPLYAEFYQENVLALTCEFLTFQLSS